MRSSLTDGRTSSSAGGLGPAISENALPIIFRPFHGANVTVDEYVQLWRFTVDYLRDEKGLHNLLFAYSTDVFTDEEDYLELYPGHEYVDVLGYDDY